MIVLTAIVIGLFMQNKIGKPKPEKKPKRKGNPSIDKEAILAKRISLMCDCGCGQAGHDLHHALIGRRKGYPILDDERNLVLVNHWQHDKRMFDNLEWRKKFWKVQIERFGHWKMIAWVQIIPDKLRDRIDWL